MNGLEKGILFTPPKTIHRDKPGFRHDNSKFTILKSQSEIKKDLQYKLYCRQ
ncbi:MAG: hypothetical protein PHT06_02195 [Dehalococcoidales bacterium]|nr:hypothetical protein [Dehalococcoidales bacterium]